MSSISQPEGDTRSPNEWKFARGLGSLKSGVDFALKAGAVIALLQAAQLIGDIPDINVSSESLRVIDIDEVEEESASWAGIAMDAAQNYNSIVEEREQVETRTIGTSTLTFLPAEVPDESATPIDLAPIVFFSSEQQSWVLFDGDGTSRLPSDPERWSSTEGTGNCDGRVVVVHERYGRTGCRPLDGGIVGLTGNRGVPQYVSSLIQGSDSSTRLSANELDEALGLLDSAFYLRSATQISNIGDGDAREVRIDAPGITGPDPDGEGTTVVNAFRALDRGSCGGTGASSSTDFRLEAGKSCSINHRTELAFREDLPTSPPIFVVTASNQDRRFNIASVGLGLIVVGLIALIVVAIWDYRTAKPDAY